jgi:hypothetical protein
MLLAAVTLAAAPARAAGPRVVLDRAELEPSLFPGLARLRLFVTAVQLEGALIPVGGADPFVLTLGGGRRREPYLLGRYAASGAATAVVIVVHTGWEMRDDLDVIREAVGHLIDGLPDDAQIAIMSYGESVDGGHRLAAARAAADRRVDRLEPDAAPADPQLLSAVERAAATLARARAAQGASVPLRRIVVVLSDGKDADPEPSRYRAVADQARRQEVRVHSVAYSPIDDRGPLLGLGELSKRSGGTFRWVRAREGFRPQVDTLLAEINQQYVLTFFIPPDQVIGKRITLRYRDLESNELRVKRVECGGQVCEEDQFCTRRVCAARGDGGGGGVLRWILWIAGGLVGLMLLGGLVSALAGRTRTSAPPGPVAVVPVAPGPAVPSVGFLFVAVGPYQGQRMPLRHGFVVGSARGCDFLLPDPRVSPHHAIFVADGQGGYAVVDRGSATGTFVNGVRITEARLQHGNLIRIGGCDLRFLSQ